MDYSFYLKDNTPDYKKLIEYGFGKDKDAYVFTGNLSENELYALIKITNEKIDVRVIDRAFEDDYIPFGIKDNHCVAKADVELLLEEIVSKCFVSSDITANLVEFLDKKYGIHEEPWENLPGYCTFKAPNSQKWYAIIMHIQANKIGLNGENIVDIINVKIDPDKIGTLVDNKRYFYAYHQNKKNWITILLDKYTDMEALKKLIDDSFRLVEIPKKVLKEWIVPANPKYYDVDKMICEDPNHFLWKQSNSIQPHDIVYLYLASPISAIKYKFEVVKTSIPYDYVDKNVNMKYVMELKLLKEYKTPVSFETLKKFGVNAVRGPRSLPENLLSEIEKYE